MNQQPINDHARRRAMEDFIRENRETYNRKAITDALLAQGHTLQEIDHAWDFVRRSVTLQPPPKPNTKSAYVGFVALWLGVMLALFKLGLFPCLQVEILTLVFGIAFMLRGVRFLYVAGIFIALHFVGLAILGTCTAAL